MAGQTKTRMWKDIEEAFAFAMDDVNSKGIHQTSFQDLLSKVHDIVFIERDATEQQKMVGALCEVMMLNIDLNYAKLVRFGIELLKARVTPEFILENYGAGCAYYQNTYWGKKGEWPNEASIRTTIERALRGWPVQEDRTSADKESRNGMVAIHDR